MANRGVLVFAIGAIITWIAEHYIWHAANLVINIILNCSTINSNNWQEICNQTKLYYYIGEGIISFAGGIVPAVIFVKILRRREN